MKTLLEVREYSFEDGTKLLIQLDRKAKKASFVKWNGHEYVEEKFIFSGRELGYMSGWKNILSAMRYVIDDIKEEMEKWDTEETDQLIYLLAAMEDKK